MPGFTLRTTIYSLILVFSAAETGLGVGAAFTNTDLYWLASSKTAMAAGVLAFPVFLTSIALLVFNNRPYSSNLMARAKFHLYANTFIAILSAVSAALLLTHLGVNCDFETPSDGLAPTWCAMRVSPSILGWINWALSTIMTILFCREGRFEDNVAERADLHRKVEPTV